MSRNLETIKTYWIFGLGNPEYIILYVNYSALSKPTFEYS